MSWSGATRRLSVADPTSWLMLRRRGSGRLAESLALAVGFVAELQTCSFPPGLALTCEDGRLDHTVGAPAEDPAEAMSL